MYVRWAKKSLTLIKKADPICETRYGDVYSDLPVLTPGEIYPSVRDTCTLGYRIGGNSRRIARQDETVLVLNEESFIVCRLTTAHPEYPKFT